VKQFISLLPAILVSAASISMTIAAREPSATTNEAPAKTPPAVYNGFDRDLYPGDAAFSTLQKTFSFTGYWLSPPPAEKITTWTGKRDFLCQAGFGFLVLFRGRLSHEFKKDSDGTAKGSLDAQAAVAAARREGFPPGTIIFLDIEEGGRLSATYHAYLHAWFDDLERVGYRAGVYCSGMPAKESGEITIVTADDIRASAGSRQYAFLFTTMPAPRLRAVYSIMEQHSWHPVASPMRKRGNMLNRRGAKNSPPAAPLVITKTETATPQPIPQTPGSLTQTWRFHQILPTVLAADFLSLMVRSVAIGQWSVMAITRRVRLYCSDQMCSSGLSSGPRTSQESFDNGASRPPFSQSSAAPADANSRRLASSSLANFIPYDYM
jgi:hypothetical protein